MRSSKCSSGFPEGDIGTLSWHLSWVFKAGKIDGSRIHDWLHQYSILYECLCLCLSPACNALAHASTGVEEQSVTRSQRVTIFMGDAHCRSSLFDDGKENYCRLLDMLVRGTESELQQCMQHHSSSLCKNTVQKRDSRQIKSVLGNEFRRAGWFEQFCKSCLFDVVDKLAVLSCISFYLHEVPSKSMNSKELLNPWINK